ncbi:MAG: biotin synthase BioB [Proteobacteria bacterium]|nr:biotin synthase BioB [Pseudomonadota bacterium]MBU1687027.1 biotin synthase BioB [Pseudomonadota bacterium]
MINREEIEKYRKIALPELMSMALAEKLRYRARKVSLCTIINAKSGKCSEDCRFCVQSGHYNTEAPVYPLKSNGEILAAAREALRIGSGRFSLVTSGRGMGKREIGQVAEVIAAIRSQVGIEVCGSFGIQDVDDFRRLKEAGLSRYHHNLETSREYFPQVVSTHTFDERVETIRAAHEAGLQVCAGGIFGLGESEEDRISMALTLRELQVDSIPINVLIPLPGTPLADCEPPVIPDILRSIALYRLINPEIPIRLAAGRENVLADFLGQAFMAGVDGMMIGGYLTQKGRLPEQDLQFVEAIRGIWEG